MTMDTETVLDRRRLRRRVSFWRSIGVIGVVIVIGLLALGRGNMSSVLGTSQIARVSIEGTIQEDRKQLKLLKEIAEAKHVEALLLYINSPGGTTTGGEALYEALREVAQVKPVVAQFGTVAASAGYIIGLGTDYIVTRGNTITGSVGVIVTWPEVSELLGKIGLDVNEIRSGELKAKPSLFEKANENDLVVVRGMVEESFQWFLTLVKERRKIDLAAVPGLKSGRIYSGREAVKLKLADEIGGEKEAKRWLEDKRGVTKDLDIVDWKPSEDAPWPFASALAKTLGGVFGQGSAQIGQLLARDRTLSTLGLDGLLSIWHPSKN